MVIGRHRLKSVLFPPTYLDIFFNIFYQAKNANEEYFLQNYFITVPFLSRIIKPKQPNQLKIN